MNYLVKAPFARRSEWQEAYSDSSKPENFQLWLKLMFESGEEYIYNSIFSNIKATNLMGLLTYRYLWLSCQNRTDLLSDKCPRTFEALQEWEAKNCYVKRFIKLEEVSEGVLALLDEFGYEITDEQRAKIIENKRTNASSRSRDIRSFYTDELRALVAERDKLIVEKFGYHV